VSVLLCVRAWAGSCKAKAYGSNPARQRGSREE
jgi:hypothetical protein